MGVRPSAARATQGDDVISAMTPPSRRALLGGRDADDRGDAGADDGNA